MNKARNLTEFLEGLKYFVVPSQNTVYADRYGVVAYFASGYFPVREGVTSPSMGLEARVNGGNISGFPAF